MSARAPLEHQSEPPASGEKMLRFPAFQALRYRNFRLLWSGMTASSVGTWIQIVAQGLLVLELTSGSATALGAVSLVQALAFLLLAPLGGRTADRVDRRRLLLVTQSIMMGCAVLMGTLTATGVIRFWMIPLIAFLSSAALSFDQPTKNALLASLVPKENLLNAVALQAAVFNGASMVGPALAGIILARFGYAASFFLNGASYLAVLVALLLLRMLVV
jgi:MFS family permease